MFAFWFQGQGYMYVFAIQPLGLSYDREVARGREDYWFKRARSSAITEFSNNVAHSYYRVRWIPFSTFLSVSIRPFAIMQVG